MDLNNHLNQSKKISTKNDLQKISLKDFKPCSVQFTFRNETTLETNSPDPNVKAFDASLKTEDSASNPLFYHWSTYCSNNNNNCDDDNKSRDEISKSSLFVETLDSDQKTTTDKEFEPQRRGTKRLLERDQLISHICGCCFCNATYLCVNCKKMFYCSKECQVNDWQNHKKDCVIKE